MASNIRRSKLGMNVENGIPVPPIRAATTAYRWIPRPMGLNCINSASEIIAGPPATEVGRTENGEKESEDALQRSKSLTGEVSDRSCPDR